MLHGLPNQLHLEKLDQFELGDPDASLDPLFRENPCLCRTKSITEFLYDRHSILVGERGTGKTAIFEMLKDKILTFPVPADTAYHIIAIDESFDYRLLRDHVVSGIYTKMSDISLKYRIAWEVFLLHRIISKIKELPNLPAQLATEIAQFENAFSTTGGQISLVDFFISNKKKIGIKFDLSAFGTPSADLYLQVSPDDTLAANESSTIFKTLKLRPLKQQITEFLRANKVYLYVLVDKIDEFVIRDDYDTQRYALQGLIAVEKDYLGFGNIKLKLFLRADLFRKLDLSESGADKVSNRTIELLWTSEEIRGFLAKRIFFNYLRIFDLQGLGVIVDSESLYIDRTANDQLSIGKTPIARWYHKLKGTAMRYVVGKWPNSRIGRRIFNRERRTSFNDSIHRDLLHSFFGEEVLHINSSRISESIGLTKYLSTHFTFCTGHTTPRLMLLFAKECVISSRDFYRNNTDLALHGVQDFPVVKREIVMQAYAHFKAKLWEIIALEGKQLGTSIRLLKNKLHGETVSAKFIVNLVRFANKQEQDEFFAVMNHLGVLSCVNRNLPVNERVYKLPMLFRSCPNMGDDRTMMLPFGSDLQT